MTVYPAIDILGGKAVRLVQGDYGKASRYFDDPLEAAVAFAAQGACCLHIVDLDGAKVGRGANTEIIKRILSQTGLWVQTGGGVRDEAAIDNLLQAGVKRVILGSAALKDIGWLCRMISKYGDAVAVGVDAKDGMVALHGWTETSRVPATDFCARLAELGLSTLIFTDISRDGMLSGPDLASYLRLRGIFKGNLIASGGVASAGDITALKKAGADGVIIGKALYENKFSLKKALEYAY